MSNFFNAIGMADLEKVHSAMIAWILDDDNDPSISGNSSNRFKTFPIEHRSQLLCKLFNVFYHIDFKSIKAYTEWNDIDILIQTRDYEEKEDIWVIENKLKTQEHKSNYDSDGEVWQTVKYRELIENTFPTKSKHYLLLSLGGDEAKDKAMTWSVCTYSVLREHLNESLKNNEDSYPLIQEYSACLTSILDALECFLNSNNRSEKYPHVFHKLKKANKNNVHNNDEERYIIENGLETIFQKQLLAKLINDNLPHIKKSIEFDERNGIAMFLQTIQIIQDFKLIIEFQGGTYKVALHHTDYIMQSSSNQTIRLYGNLVKNEWDGDVYGVFKKQSSKDWRIAVSKNLKKGIGEVKPRIALDKNLGKKWCDNVSQFANVYQEALNLAKSISKELDSLNF